MSKKYWLIKSESAVFSIDDLQNAENGTTHWDGVRNYQARNFLRDQMKIGDSVLFYHSNSEPNAVVGVCEVVREGYPDFTAFDAGNKHYDPKSTMENPAWYMVDVKFVEKLKKPVTLEDVKNNPKLVDMQLAKRGNRLSVMPILKEEFNEIIKMSK